MSLPSQILSERAASANWPKAGWHRGGQRSPEWLWQRFLECWTLFGRMIFEDTLGCMLNLNQTPPHFARISLPKT